MPPTHVKIEFEFYVRISFSYGIPALFLHKLIGLTFNESKPLFIDGMCGIDVGPYLLKVQSSFAC